MGVKTARTKQVRKEFKKAYKAVEICSYCRKKVADMDGHILAAHGYICERCGHRFATEAHWRQHMRDLHGLDAKAAVQDDAKKKIDRWVKGSKKGGKAARRAAAAAGGANAMDTEGVSPLATVCGSFRHVCELCSAEAMLPSNLADCGLSFTCAHIGRRCGTPGQPMMVPAGAQPPAEIAPRPAVGVFARPATAQATNPLAPAPPAPSLFGPAAAPSTSFGTQPAAPFGAAAPFGTQAAAPSGAQAAMELLSMAQQTAVPGLEDSDEDL
mmetsp:Transcript_28110/g.80784  ORF Transcript_28110/g.80784 Transcript_28110/m.80784 type:complete len:269 (+) Transcript_28110:94-900(+)